MTSEEFITKVDAKMTQCYKLLKQKQTAYKTDTDPFNNFRQFAHLSGTTQEQALLAYAGKQIVQLYNPHAIENDPNYEERVMDVLNYMAILLVMIDEGKG